MRTINDELAEELGRSKSTLRRICIENGIGEVINSYVRVLSDADVEKLKSLVTTSKRGGTRPGSGRPRKEDSAQ